MEAVNGIDNGNNRRRTKKFDLFRPISVRPNGDRIESANWCVRFQHHGKRTCRSLGTPDYRVAQQRAKELVKTVKARGWESATKIHGDPASLSIADLLAKYEAAAVGRGLKHWAVVTPMRCFALIARKTGATRLAQVTPERIQQWINTAIADGKIKPTTVASKLKNGAAIFAKASLAAMNLNGVRNPFLEIVRPQVTREAFAAPPREWIQKLMAQGLRELVGEPRTALVLALGCGLRWNEMATLTWDNVTAKGARILGTFAKTRRQRIVPMGETVRSALGAPATGLVITEPKLTHEALCAWLRQQGVSDQKPVHYLRKCFGSLAVADHGIFLAAKLLGHANIQMTAQVYAGAVDCLPAVKFGKDAADA